MAMGNYSTPLELLFFRPRHLTVEVPPVPKLGLELQYKDSAVGAVVSEVEETGWASMWNSTQKEHKAKPRHNRPWYRP